MLNKRALNVIEEALSKLTISKILTIAEAQECLMLLHNTTGNPHFYTEMQNHPILVLTVEETAETLRVTPKTIHSYCNAGELNRIKLGYRATRISVNDIKDFLSRHTCCHSESMKAVSRQSNLKMADQRLD